MARRTAVVDGSNIATEGRSEPSLRQLREAVAAFTDEYRFDQVIVVVDATFEHRVGTRERKAVKTAIDNGEILTPPAGVIGRGDAFILQVADKADAVVLSNDSFQEFHGTYPWLFAEGRLIGGKPVPGVGWVFVARSPVRGPVSRRATATKKASGTANVAKAPTKKDAAKATNRTAKKAAKKAATRTKRRTAHEDDGSAAVGRGEAGEGANNPAAWRRFRRAHPVGSEVSVTVDRFSSHGAYAISAGLTIYLPNRLLGDPPPSRARDVIEVGQTRDVIIHRYDSDRHGIDAGLIPVPAAATKAATKKTSAKKTAAKRAAPKTATKKAATKRTATKRAAPKTATKKAATKRTAAKRAAPKTSTSKKTSTKTTSAKKTAGKNAATERSTTRASARTTTRRR